MSLDVPNNARMLSSEQISSLSPGQRVFHSEWGEGVYRGKRIDVNGNERFIIDNYRDGIVLKDLNGDLYLLDDFSGSAPVTERRDNSYHPEPVADEHSGATIDSRDAFLNKVEDDLDSLSGQLNENREDVVSIDSVKSYQAQTSDLLGKITREIEFTEGKLRKLKDLRQSLYTHLGKVGHYVNEGESTINKGFFGNENVDKAKSFLQRESQRFYEELKEEINDLRNSFGFIKSRKEEN